MKFTFDLKDCSWKLLKKMAQECRSAEDLKHLLEFNPECTAEEIAANSHADKGTLTYIYNEYKFNKNVCYGLAKNPSVPLEIIHELAQKCNFVMGEALLMNCNLLAQDIDIIVGKYGNVRSIAEVAVCHPNISCDTSKKLVDMHKGIIQN